MTKWFVGVSGLITLATIRRFVLKEKFPRVSASLAFVSQGLLLVAVMENALGDSTELGVLREAVAAGYIYWFSSWLLERIYGPVARYGRNFIVGKHILLISLLSLALYDDFQFSGIVAAFVGIVWWLAIKDAVLDFVHWGELVKLGGRDRRCRQDPTNHSRRKADKLKSA